MNVRTLTSFAVGLTVAGGLLAAGAPAYSAADDTDTGAVAVAVADAAASNLRVAVKDTVGKRWKVRFVDDSGTVLGTVKRDSIRLKTTKGPARAERVIWSRGNVVKLSTSKRGMKVKVRIVPAGDGAFSMRVTGVGNRSKSITRVKVDFEAPTDERYLGMGERSDAVDHRGHTVLNKVQDGPYTENQQIQIQSLVPKPGIGDRPDSTYFPVPWILSTSGYGVLVENDEDSLFKLSIPKNRGVNRLIVKSNQLELKIFGGPTPAEALARMTEDIGRQPAPSTPALFGAWFQKPEDNSAWTDAFDEQRAAGVPVSVAEVSIHYLPCGSERSGDASGAQLARTNDLHDRGVMTTAYFNPMVCTDYESAYQAGLDADAFTKNPDGSTLTYKYSTRDHFFVSQVDFSSAAGRDYYKSLLQKAVDQGYDGWMEDFGEYTPQNAVSADGTPGPTMHNRYVEQYHSTAREFEEETERPLLRFQRSGWTDAIKEASIVWGGDPTTTWGYDGLTSSVSQGLTMGTSGVSVWGPDIGGFFTLIGDSNRSEELLNRWIEFGAFTGVMRLQNGGIKVSGVPTRPTVTDAGVAPIWKRYTRLRTMLYPYIAGSQDEYLETGMPLMRHLALVHPDDSKAVRTNDEYLFGDDLLVAPITKQGATSRSTYLPEGQWIELANLWDLDDEGNFSLGAADLLAGKQTVNATAPIDVIPLFLRAGAVIPMLPNTVDTLSTYGMDDEDLVHLTDEDGRRTLLAAPSVGSNQGTLGPDESLTSEVTDSRWSLKVSASQARTYDVRATLSSLDSSWVPCDVKVGGQSIDFVYDAEKRVLEFSADLAADGEVTVLGDCA